MPIHLKGNIKHSVAHWPFCLDRDKVLQTRPDEPMPLDTRSLVRGLRELGIVKPVIELAPQADYNWLANEDVVNAMGFVNAFGDENIPPFVRGWNNPKYRKTVDEATGAEITACAKHGWPNVIAFVGYATDPTDGGSPIKPSKAMASCVTGLKQIASYAEERNVTICLEHLSTRDASHPMKGHPGYQGDDLDFVAEIVRRVGSPNVKMLFDIYHVQVMHGDVIRRLQALLKEGIVGHIHTAGCPGRGELDQSQELFYPAIMTALVAGGYKGYVGHEHIPQWNDKLKSIATSIQVCDV